MSSIDIEEEKQLLAILFDNDRALSIRAFKRLVRAYRKSQINGKFYEFLENCTYLPNNETNIILEYLYDFFTVEDFRTKHITINTERISRIYNNTKIMSNLYSLLQYDQVQDSLLVILNLIFYHHPCKDEWAVVLIDILYRTNRESTERLCCKIILLFLKNTPNICNLKPENLIKLKKKINEVVYLNSNSNNKITKNLNNKSSNISAESTIDNAQKDANYYSGVFYELNNLLTNRVLTYNLYIQYLNEGSFEKIFFFADSIFLNKEKASIKDNCKIISNLMIKFILSMENNIYLVLHHCKDLVNLGIELRDGMMDSRLIEKLFEISETGDEDVRYLSTIILRKLI